MVGHFEYLKIRSIEEGCQALAEAAGGAAVLAGGTDLLVEIRNGLKSPSLLVDCKGIETLGQVDFTRSQTVVGASVPLNRLIEHREFRSAHPALTQALASIGTYQLRNRATLAGNICNASPAADSAPVLLILGAEIDVAGVHGTRTVPIGAFFTGVKRTVLQPGEIVTSVRIPVQPDLRTAFRKQQRIRGHDLAVVNVAGAYAPRERRLTIAIGSCAPTPVLLDPIPVDGKTDRTFVAHVVETACSCVTPISDVRASAEYRRAVLPVLVQRVLHDVLSEGGAA